MVSAPQKVLSDSSGAFSSTIHRNNLILHPNYLGEEQASPQYFLPFSGGASTLLVTSGSQLLLSSQFSIPSWNPEVHLRDSQEL